MFDPKAPQAVLESLARTPANREGLVVAIGASAGGLEALERLFRFLPDDTGLSFVVVQHLSPDHESMMDELLARYTEMPVVVAEHDMPLRQNGVYLIPPKRNMIVEQRQLKLVEPDPEATPNLPIDLFFGSVGRDVGALSVGVILSGTGSDGSRGLEVIRQAGGLVIAQDVESAQFDGMPRAAQKTKQVDVIASPETIPEWIVRYSLDPAAFPRDRVQQMSHEQLVLAKDPNTAEILAIFRERFGIDFSFYRSSTIARRLERRVQSSGAEDLAAYLSQLSHDDAEIDALYRDLLVDVTRFFRDPEAFEALKASVTIIIENAVEGGEIRVWCPGCATGEEAYTLAMICDDVATTLGRDVKVKVFATDVHPVSLETGSAGVYSAKSLASVPQSFKDRYFQRVGELYHVTQDLRRHVIFASHDITKDPPFTRVDLVTCRNVLIYLEPVIQHKVLSLFHFGMKLGGVLMLGPSESLGKLEPEFEQIDLHWRLFRKLRNVRLPHATTSQLRSPLNQAFLRRPTFVASTPRPQQTRLLSEAHEELLIRFAPMSFLVNEQQEVVHSFGGAERLLIQPAGRMTLDVTKLVSKDLSSALVAGLLKIRTNNESVSFVGVVIETLDENIRCNVTIERFEKSLEPMFFICLEPADVSARAGSAKEAQRYDFDPNNTSAEHISDLERELAYTRETLQATVEQLESSNEELQSTNEELVAANEELQSTNEELHSVNEELHTVNVEHQRKIEELTRVTADMDNLLNNSQVATLFLDGDLRIRRFTPALQEIYHVIEQDVGRTISHIANTLAAFDLETLAARAGETNAVTDAEVESKDGRLYQVHCSPHASADAEIGFVVTFFALNANS